MGVGGGGDLAGYNTSCQHLVYTLSANVISQNNNFTGLQKWLFVFQIKQTQGIL